MNLNEERFFNVIRSELAKTGLRQKQVEGCQNLLAIWYSEYSEYPDEYLAYCLATAWHETAFTMEPIGEYGKGRGRSYGAVNKDTGKAYYGRGYVQLTWGYNYKKAGQSIGMGFELYNNPDRALQPDVAAKILYLGCIEGWFTSKKLGDYITDKKADYRQCRRIVNGMDKSRQIAKYAQAFEEAIKESQGELVVTEEKLLKAGSQTIKAAKSNKDAGGAVIGVGAVGGAATMLEKAKELAGKTSEWRTVIDSLMDGLSWGLQYWWVAALASGGVLYWNNRAIIKARIKDELKIGRLIND